MNAGPSWYKSWIDPADANPCGCRVPILNFSSISMDKKSNLVTRDC